MHRNLNTPSAAEQRRRTNARQTWRDRLGLETGGPDWKVQGPPGPLSPAAELALLAVRELRRELASDMAGLDMEIGRSLKMPDSLEAKRVAFRAATSPFDLATRRLRHRRRIA